MAPRTLHLHIGLPKTGTTFLQDRIFPRLPGLQARCMPRTRLFEDEDEDGAAPRLMASCARRAPRIWRERGEAVFGELFGDKPAWRARREDALISEEAVSRLLGGRPSLLAAHLSALAEAAAGWGFERVTAICVLRRQDRWLGSHYAQLSHRTPNAGQADFESMVERVLDPRRERFRFGALLDYDALLEALDVALGPEAVFVSTYETLETDPATFRMKLLRHLGIDLETAGEADAWSRRSNARSDSADRWRLRPSQPRTRFGRMVSRLRPLRTGTITLTPAMSDRILSSYEVSNRACAKRVGLELLRFGYIAEGGALSAPAHGKALSTS